ncbi:MAG: putative bifunctional diguanylate cyclase/phosphodiesterase [Lautropia sp.]
MNSTAPSPAIADARSIARDQRSEDVARLTRALVMVATADTALRDAIVHGLAGAGYDNVVNVADPTRLAAELAAQQPDVLLLDAAAPDAAAPDAAAPDAAAPDAAAPDAAAPHAAAPDAGIATLQALRGDERWRELPVILLVGSGADAAVRRRALELDAIDVLARPVEPSELALRLRNALGFKVFEGFLLKRDPLTGLANRGEFIRRIGSALDGGAPRALLMFDVDRFKAINDSLGHQRGDALLQSIAARLAAVIGRHAGADRRGTQPAATPWLARIDGDRFMALLPGRRGEPVHDACVADLLALQSVPYHIDGRELFVAASMGLAQFPDDGDGVDVLTQRAELAVLQAKRRGGHRVEYFTGALESRASERLTLEHHLRYAIRRGELQLHYQPKVDCRTRRMVGVEALVRWQHPQRGSISPVRFIPIAEATGLIVEVGEWVLAEACRQGRAWIDDGLPPLSIAVNMSAAQAARGDLAATVAATLAASGFPPERLTLELTETVLMEPGDRPVQLLAALKALGVSLSLDDFGTGHSSLTYLRRFPFDEIKIDRGFVHGLPHDRDSVAIVTAIATLAAGLGLRVVAEGVASADELAFLQRLPECRFQGELFSRPVPADQLARMLRAETMPLMEGIDPKVPSSGNS